MKSIKRLVSSLLVVIMLMTMMITAMPFTTSAYTSRTREEAKNWIVTAANNNYSYDYDGAYGAQCVDFIYTYYSYLGVSPVGGNAIDYTSNALPSGWKRIAYYDGFVAQAGDIAVFQGPTWAGHVALVIAANEWTMDIAEQNYNYQQYVTHNTYWYTDYSFYGVIRPDFPEYSTYTVSYNANGGSGAPSSQTKTYGATLTLSSTKPTRSGYTFTGWNTKADGSGTSYAAGASYTVNAAVTLYAQWKANTYTVSYNANGGSGAPSSQTKTQDVTLTLSSTKPTRTGYTFTGWNTKADGTGTSYAAGASYTANAAVTLYAQWKANTFTVSYNANGGSGAPSSQTKTYGVSLTLSSTKPIRTGYTFTGWNTKADGTGTSYAAGASYTGNSAVTLYAQWSTNTYTNSLYLWASGFENGEGNSGTKKFSNLGKVDFTQKYGDSYVLDESRCIFEIPRGFYRVDGWGTDINYVSGDYVLEKYEFGTEFTQPAKNVYFEYICSPYTYTITYELNGGTNSADNPASYNVLYGITLEDPVRENYIFTGWTDADGNVVTGINPGANADHSSAQELYDMLSTRTIGDQTLYANWTHICENGHDWSDVESVDATCTTNGTEERICNRCGEVEITTIPATGHDWSAWVQVTAPTETEDGEKLRYCKTCKISETKIIPALGVPVDPNAPAVISLDNYTITLDKIENIKEIRFAIGRYTKGSDIKAAEKNVTLDASTVKKYTAGGMLTYDLPWMGEYTFWVRYNDGTQYFVYTTVDDITPYVESDGVKITVKDYAENYKDMWIAEGSFNSYNEIKASTAFKYQASANKLDIYAKTTHDFSYTMTNPGDYTVLIRYNDGTVDVIHHTLTVDYPEFSANGLQITVSNIPGIKIIRTAPGHHTSVAAIKKVDGVRNFNNKIIKDAESYMLQYRDAGEVTLIVEYNNGYKHFYYHNIEPKKASMIQNENTVMFGNINGFVMIRYAEGVYTTSNQIKLAEGSKVIKPSDVIGGLAVVNGLEVGTYTFCVQFDDESYDFHVVTVSEADPEYNVSFDVNGGEGSFENITLCNGDTYGEMPVPERTGYTFYGWYTEKDGGILVTSDSAFELNEDQVLYAHWSVLSYTASWSNGTGYSISVNRTESPYACASTGVINSGDAVYYGDRLSVTYTKADYYHITSSGDSSVTVTGDVTSANIYATAELNEVSGWVKASALPSGAQVTSEKWTYNLTSYIKKSTSASISGYTQYNSYEEVTDSGSFKYASFPGNYNMNDWYGQNWNRSPYTPYDNGSTRRVVSNNLTGYIYWHWVYPLSGNHTEDNRAIGEYYNEYIPGAGYTTIWEVFDSTTNAEWVSSAFKFTGHSSYSYWWFRVDYYTCNYTDYTKYYDHKKVEEKTSTTAVTAGGDISNVVKWVQYREK